MHQHHLTCCLSALPQFSGLYLVSLVVILIGFIVFNAVPTPADSTDLATSSTSSICEEGYDNPVASQDDITQREVAVKITTAEREDEEEEQRGGGEKEEGLEEEERRKKKRASGPSPSLGGGNHDVAVRRSTKM